MRKDFSHIVLDLKDKFKTEVIEYFNETYKQGATPNPCAICNYHVKWGELYNYALKELDCDYFATGHYAKIVHEDGHSKIFKCFDQNKDQSYFLAQVSKEALDKCLFPLGNIDKQEVRKIANELKLSIADKKDSTGICFIGERNFREFLKNYIPMKEGNIVDIDTNEVIGKHNGVYYYTIGQRKGLGVSFGRPAYVVSIKGNDVILGFEDELFKKEVIVN